MCHQSAVDERVHTYSVTNGQSIICLYMTGLGANFTIREVASNNSSCDNCHCIYQGTFSTYDTVSMISFHGFVLFSVSLIPVSTERGNEERKGG